MKWLAYIGIAIMLAQVLAPCGDVSEGPTEDQSAVLFDGAASVGNHDHACSPFCTCSCCHTHIQLSCALCLGAVPSFVATYPPDLVRMYARFTGQVWDPPRRV